MLVDSFLSSCGQLCRPEWKTESDGRCPWALPSPSFLGPVLLTTLAGSWKAPTKILVSLMPLFKKALFKMVSSTGGISS